MELLNDPQNDRKVKNVKPPPHRPLSKELMWGKSSFINFIQLFILSFSTLMKLFISFLIKALNFVFNPDILTDIKRRTKIILIKLRKNTIEIFVTMRAAIFITNYS